MTVELQEGAAPVFKLQHESDIDEELYPDYMDEQESDYSHTEDSEFKNNFLKLMTEELHEGAAPVVKLQQESDVDEELYTDYTNKQESSREQAMLLVRKELPSYHMKDSILSASKTNPVSKSSNYSHVKDSEFKNNSLEPMTVKLHEGAAPIVKLQQNSDVDEKLYTDYMNKQENSRYQATLLVRKKIPSYDMKDRILDLIERNHICVITGESGCGKTTQIPQYILDHFLENKKGSLCRIVCTQPRRISAISVAQRIAEERIECVGRSVGYHYKLER